MIIKGWRTITVNAIALVPFIVDIVLAFAAEGGGDFIPDAWAPYYGVALVIANVYLRTITTTPMGRKE